MGIPDAPEMLDLGDREDVTDVYARHGWGDGLPLVAPTPERVEAMLAAVPNLDPGETLAVLPPRNGAATVRTVAVNAVLAGCEPRQFAVLVAATRALGDPALNLRGVNATTHPVAPLLLVHGLAATEGGFASGTGALGPGNRANATTGRALRLLLLHVAGATPGPGDASTQGGPAKYSYCAAENVAESPWGGYAASRGVMTTSAVTLHCGEAPHNVHDMENATPGRILDKVASAMTSLAQNNACISQGEYFVLLCPEHAATIAEAGWSRDDVSRYLFHRARVPMRTLREHFDSVAWEPWMHALTDDDLAPMTGAAEHIRVVVVGGPGKHSSVVPSWGMTASVTVPVPDAPVSELPGSGVPGADAVGSR